MGTWQTQSIIQNTENTTTIATRTHPIKHGVKPGPSTGLIVPASYKTPAMLLIVMSRSELDSE